MRLAKAVPLKLPGAMGAVHRANPPSTPLLPAGIGNPVEKPLRRPRKKAAFAHSRPGAAFLK